MKQVDVAYGSAQRLGIERWQSGVNKGAYVQILNGSRIIQRGVLDVTLRRKFEVLAAKVFCIKAYN